MLPTRALINPVVLAWARGRARFSPDEAADRLGVSRERYRSWEEEGDERPTVNQLAAIASLFHRSPVIFYREKPPEEPEVLAEMRRLGAATGRPDSPDLALQVRLAVERRALALELHAELGERPPAFDLRLTLTDRPDDVADAVRDLLGVPLEEQLEWGRTGGALRNWRAAFEGAGVLVFQVPGVPLDEMRGFAVADRPLPVVAYNSRERSDAARVFTMFHELAHVLLGVTSLDMAGTVPGEAHGEVEAFCNALAAEALVPREALLSVDVVRSYGNDGIWAGADVERLARRFGVSPAVMVRRLWALDRVAAGVYEELRELFDSYRAPDGGEEGAGSGGNTYRNRLVHLGYYLTGLAFRAYESGRLTASSLSGIVGLQAKSLDRLADTMYGRRQRWSDRG